MDEMRSNFRKLNYKYIILLVGSRNDI